MTKHDCAVIMAYTGAMMLIGDDIKIFYEYITRLMDKPIYSHELPEYADEIKERAKSDFIEICKSAGDAPDWILCSDRLPDRDTLAVFVSFEPWIYPDQPWCFYPHIGYRYGNQWQDSQTGAVFDDDDNKCKVTHWFPFPDVPSSGIPSVSPLDFLAVEWERKHPQQIQFQE